MFRSVVNFKTAHCSLINRVFDFLYQSTVHIKALQEQRKLFSQLREKNGFLTWFGSSCLSYLTCFFSFVFNYCDLFEILSERG